MPTSGSSPEQEKAQQQAILKARQMVTVLLLDGALYSPIQLPQLVLSMHEHSWEALLPPIMNTPCLHCSGVPTTSWRLAASYHDKCTYECVSCKKASVTYYMELQPQDPRLVTFPSSHQEFTRAQLQKVGQVPAWIAPVPDLLKKALGDEGVQHYRQGASSLRAGRGVGAVAYFRRIVEDHVDDLLRVLEEAATATGDDAALKRIQAAKDVLQATERLKIAADNTPAILRPGGHNPIATLYELLSEGLHKKSDQENAVIASRAQKALAFFFETWAAYRERSKEYADEITKTATKTP